MPAEVEDQVMAEEEDEVIAEEDSQLKEGQEVLLVGKSGRKHSARLRLELFTAEHYYLTRRDS